MSGYDPNMRPLISKTLNNSIYVTLTGNVLQGDDT